MASACVNNITMSPEKFPPATYHPSYGWLTPRLSFSREEEASPSPSKLPAAGSSKNTDSPLADNDPSESLDPVDFEFRLHDPVTMLPADELFSDGKLMPLQVAGNNNNKPLVNSNTNYTSSSSNGLTEIIRSSETTSVSNSNNNKSSVRSSINSSSSRLMEMEISGTDAYLFSPKAPRCSSRWKELLGLKKLYQNANAKSDTTTTSKTMSLLSSSSSNPNTKSLKHFLHRSSKSGSCNSSSSSSYSPSYITLDHSLSLPLLRDSDCESVSISSSRLSLSSSSSSHDHEDLPRLSLDSDKPNPNPNPSPNPFVLNRNQNPPRMRMVKARSSEVGNSNNGNNSGGSSSNISGNNTAGGNRVGRSPMRRGTSGGDQQSSRGVSVDSPRMNSSGKIVFQSLERSSSSPSSFNGGPRYKHRGMERSYSANVRVTPVLNVPVCSLRGTSKSFGFGQLFSSSPQKRECGNKGQLHLQQHHHQQHHTNSTRNRT